MKKYAVSFINFYDNDLITKIVETEGNWRDAFNIALFPNYHVLTDDMDFEKDCAFDHEWLFDVVEIK